MKNLIKELRLLCFDIMLRVALFVVPKDGEECLYFIIYLEAYIQKNLSRKPK